MIGEDKFVVSSSAEAEDGYPKVRPEWFDGWMVGNLRYPQSFNVIKMLVSEAFLRQEEPDFFELQDSRLSEEQLKKIKEAMNSAHATRGIPAGTADKKDAAIAKAAATEQSFPGYRTVTDERILKLWREAKDFAIEAMTDIAYKLSPGNTSALQGLQGYLSNPQIKKEIHEVFRAAAEALKDPEALALAKEYRYMFDPKNPDYDIEYLRRGGDVSQQMKDMANKFEKLITKKVKERCPELAHKLPENIFFIR